MKKFLLITIAFIGVSFYSKAQCDSTIKWNCNKLKITDASGNVLVEKDERSTVVVDKKSVVITPEDANGEMTGTVSAFDCNWQQLGKEGKTVVKADITDGSGNVRHATITIEAAKGKTTITLVAAEEQTTITLDVADYAVVK
ncbi:hypothetical protein I5907_08230 [Panacibacter sp. DH6]|uniref:Uncharacterized protein n=1 Tax=Panacibacter microcysteis TaxID=2793269 RepID=A0A931E6T3_9BACT|nr:hypothetical protein [Panacibacter microcysteis]MBG9376219.1 hypothetical protein [Panacibacter microcysteis]